MKPRFLTLALGISLLASCSKKDTEDRKISQFANYTFNNTLEKPINIRVTDTLTGESFVLSVAGLCKVQVPNDKWLRGDGSFATYSYYWATADRKKSSWYTMQYQQLRKQTAFKYISGQLSHVIDIHTVNDRSDMLYCLQGMDGSTEWEAVDAYDSTGNSIWHTMGNSQKSHVIVLNSDMTASHSHANNIGATTIDYFDYNLYSTEDDFYLANINYTTLEAPQEPRYIRMVNNAHRADNKLVLNGKDSLYLTFYGKYPYYLMKKKNNIAD